jgi:hypothetical protein
MTFTRILSMRTVMSGFFYCLFCYSSPYKMISRNYFGWDGMRKVAPWPYSKEMSYYILILCGLVKWLFKPCYFVNKLKCRSYGGIKRNGFPLEIKCLVVHPRNQPSSQGEAEEVPVPEREVPGREVLQNHDDYRHLSLCVSSNPNCFTYKHVFLRENSQKDTFLNFVSLESLKGT